MDSTLIFGNKNKYMGIEFSLQSNNEMQKVNHSLGCIQRNGVIE